MVIDSATAPQITFGRHSSSGSRLVYSLVAVSVVVVLGSSLTWVVPRLVGAGRVTAQQLVIIDTDPGIDDAVALLTVLGDPGVQVLALTCVRGNTDLPNGAINAIKILHAAGRYDVPVYSGQNYGLLDSPVTEAYFGSDGLGDLPWSTTPSTDDIEPEHAASYLARMVKENPGKITILAIGPLTNIALAVSLNPQFLKQARRVIILGGSIRGDGNMSPGVEFNFYMDPLAASLVLDRALTSSASITLVSMELCNNFDLGKAWRWNTLGKIDNSVVSLMNKLENWEDRNHPIKLYHPYDLYAASIVLSPDVVSRAQDVYGFVDLGGRKTEGALFIDYHNYTSKPANIDLIVEINTTVIRQKMFDNLSMFN